LNWIEVRIEWIHASRRITKNNTPTKEDPGSLITDPQEETPLISSDWQRMRLKSKSVRRIYAIFDEWFNREYAIIKELILITKVNSPYPCEDHVLLIEEGHVWSPPRTNDEWLNCLALYALCNIKRVIKPKNQASSIDIKDTIWNMIYVIIIIPMIYRVNEFHSIETICHFYCDSIVHRLFEKELKTNNSCTCRDYIYVSYRWLAHKKCIRKCLARTPKNIECSYLEILYKAHEEEMRQCVYIATCTASHHGLQESEPWSDCVFRLNDIYSPYHWLSYNILIYEKCC
jgi:hypothetical protein